MIRLAVRVPRARADLVAAELLVLSPAGLEERDVDADTVELALYGAAGEVPDVGAVRAAAGEGLVDVATTEVPDDWETRWRSWHRPFTVGSGGRRVHVRPPWEPAGPDAAVDVVIDPGQAFGTGAHASTRLALGLLLECDPGGPLADWGCGSGVLAVAAAGLGFDPVAACDIEPESVRATLAAARGHGIPARHAEPPPRDASRADVAGAGGAWSSDGAPGGGEAAVGRASSSRVGIVAGRLDLRREAGPWAPVVTANLVRPLLLDIAARMERAPDRLIASGLTPDEVEEVAGAFAPKGLRLASRRDGDGWSAILLTR